MKIIVVVIVIIFKAGAYMEPREIETGKYSLSDIKNLKKKENRLSPQSNTTSEKVWCRLETQRFALFKMVVF